jgi:protein gp37
VATKIEWAQETINPIVGCTRISPGCAHCYAAPMAWRLAHNPNLPSDVRDAYRAVVKKVNGRVDWTGEVRFIPSVLDRVSRWRKPRRVFVCSMGDLFHEAVTDEMIEAVFAKIEISPRHTFMLLTKRPDRMERFINHPSGKHLTRDNVWLLTTVENQAAADERIPHLLNTPAAVRGISIEPMLGPVDLKWHLAEPTGNFRTHQGKRQIELKSHNKLHWTIVGGETGPGARPMHPDWVRSVRDQCAAAGVPFFFKSFGDWVERGYLGTVGINKGEMAVHPDGTVLDRRPTPEEAYNHGTKWKTMVRVGKRQSGRVLDGRTHDEYPDTAKPLDSGAAKG